MNDLWLSHCIAGVWGVHFWPCRSSFRMTGLCWVLTYFSTCPSIQALGMFTCTVIKNFPRILENSLLDGRGNMCLLMRQRMQIVEPLKENVHHQGNLFQEKWSVGHTYQWWSLVSCNYQPAISNKAHKLMKRTCNLFETTKIWMRLAWGEECIKYWLHSSNKCSSIILQ